MLHANPVHQEPEHLNEDCSREFQESSEAEEMHLATDRGPPPDHMIGPLSA